MKRFIAGEGRQHYLAALDRADREPGDIAEARIARLKEKIAGLRERRRSELCDRAGA